MNNFVDVSLSCGRVTKVDADDAIRMAPYTWRAEPDAAGLLYVRNSSLGRLHRWLLCAPDGVLVDHRNLDTLDNRRLNLRLASRTQNKANSRKYKNNRHTYKGVEKLNGLQPSWRATAQRDRRRYHSTTFRTALEAAFAYDDMATELFGEFARVNFPERQMVKSERPHANCNLLRVWKRKVQG